MICIVCGISITESLNSNERGIFGWRHLHVAEEKETYRIDMHVYSLIFTYIIIELLLHIEIWYADSIIYGTFAVEMNKVITKSVPKGLEMWKKWARMQTTQNSLVFFTIHNASVASTLYTY